MTERPEAEIDQILTTTADEYAEEERASAAEEAREATSAVFSVRLSPTVYDAVRQAASKAHLTPSALIRQWVSERVEDTGQSDSSFAAAVATLRRDVERLADLTPPA